MAKKFKINGGYDDEKTVEADEFAEHGSFVVFTKGYDHNADQVYAVRTPDLYRVERIEE